MARTIVVNSTAGTNNYGLLGGSPYWNAGIFSYSNPAAAEMTLAIAIWLTSNAFTCSPGSQNYKYCGADTIKFNISPNYSYGQTGPSYIIPIIQGIQIYDMLFIDGFSQSGATIGNPMIYINGQDNDGIQVSLSSAYGDASGSHVQGLGFFNTKDFAIYVSGVKNTVFNDNYIGVSPMGPIAGSLQQKGFTVVDGVQSIAIKDNVVNGCQLNAIEVLGGTPQGYPPARPISNVLISGNKIGTNLNGNASAGYGNQGSGIFISSGNTSVGPVTISNNVVVNNGVRSGADTRSGEGGIELQNVTNATLTGNYVGVLSNGTFAPNHHEGIKITGGYTPIVPASKNILIQGNNISHNDLQGIHLLGNNVSDITIGVDEFNTSGGLPNIISYNGGAGIKIESPSHYNVFRKNSIFCNDAVNNRQIDLYSTGGNDNYAGVTGPSIDLTLSNATILRGTAPANAIIDVYGSRTLAQGGCSNCSTTLPSKSEGERWFGQTTADGAGNWSYPMVGLSGTLSVLATQPGGTHSTSNTSEFSTCMLNIPLPVDFLYLNANKLTESSNLISWMTSSEKNSNYFMIQRSTNGIDFYSIGTVKDQENSTAIKLYSFEDNTSTFSGTVYYRVIQVDNDGTENYNKLVSLNTSNDTQFMAYPNPFRDEIKLIVSGSYKKNSITLLDLNGRIASKEDAFANNEGHILLNTSGLSSGVYFLEYETESERKYIKMIKY